MSTLSEKIALPPKAEMNPGLSPVNESTMLSVFGRPGELTKDCSEATGAFAGRVVTGNVGPFKVTGLDLAVASLGRIFTEVRATRQDVFDEVKTEGMLCVRHKRKNAASYSNHSWGCALDLRFGPSLVDQGDPRAQRGMVVLFPFFNRHGWYWGAEFSGDSVDSMHFELAEESIIKIRDGSFETGGGGPSGGGGTGGGHGGGGSAEALKHPMLASNAELQRAAAGEIAFKRNRDSGEPVGIIQDALDRVLPPADHINAGGNRGTFGAKTEAAVMKFQEKSGLKADGSVGKNTLLKLDAALIHLDGIT